MTANRLYTVFRYYVSNGWGEWAEHRVFTSADSGLHWAEITPLNEFGYRDTLAYYEDVVPSPIISNRVYLKKEFHTWYQSEDGGLTWVTPSFPVDTLASDARNPSWLYGYYCEYGCGVSGQGEGRRSVDGGISWHAWSTQPCQSLSFQQLVSLP